MSELKMLPNVDKLLNMDEASNLLGVRKSTLYAMVMRKQIAHIKLGKLTRFRLEDIQAYINKNLVEVRRIDKDTLEVVRIQKTISYL